MFNEAAYQRFRNGAVDRVHGHEMCIRDSVFPFNMLPEVDPVLGQEMRATGEVMGIADNFGMAYYKAQEAAGCICLLYTSRCV